MANTETQVITFEVEMNKGDANTLPSVVKQMEMGSMFAVKDDTITQSSSATVVLDENALYIQSVRVVTGTATGPRQVGDPGATLTTSVCRWDGLKTLTMEAAVTVTRVVYVKAPAVSMTAVFTPNT